MHIGFVPNILNLLDNRSQLPLRSTGATRAREQAMGRRVVAAVRQYRRIAR